MGIDRDVHLHRDGTTGSLVLECEAEEFERGDFEMGAMYGGGMVARSPSLLGRLLMPSNADSLR